MVRVVGSPVGSRVAMCQADGCLQCTNSNKTQGNFLVVVFFFGVFFCLSGFLKAVLWVLISWTFVGKFLWCLPAV